MNTPSQLGYRMPAEWEPHAGTWLTWPRSDGISFPDRYDAVPPVYAGIIKHLVAVEDVFINVWNADMEAWVRGLLTQHGTPLARVHFHHFPAYEPWCRDHGPVFLVRDRAGHRERAVVDWRYNAWGEKYPPYELDDAIPQHVAKLRGLPLFSSDMILEGGSIEVNGRGTLITTESCLLNPNRNPQLSKGQIEHQLKEFLGVSHVLWLGDGIAGDDTDGHVDDLVRFINPTTVVTVIEEDINDANYQPLQENIQRLRLMRDQGGRLLRVVKLPMPGFVEHQAQRLPASYANFYIANGLVLVPTFGHRNDKAALEILQKEFHDRRVIGIDSTDLIWGLGSFHCITQQEPA
ncbi:MAG: agmatine deiminase family protein [Verrucomicrobia bacterium]|nr:agmatine deiminase family protein [Verrucomicrobiota bacterium]